MNLFVLIGAMFVGIALPLLAAVQGYYGGRRQQRQLDQWDEEHARIQHVQREWNRAWSDEDARILEEWLS